MSELTADHFEPLVDKVLRVRGGAHALTLFKVERFERGEQAVRDNLRAPFNVLFHGPLGDLLREGLYELEAESGESFALYVIPIQTYDPGRQNYQAVFT